MRRSFVADTHEEQILRSQAFSDEQIRWGAHGYLGLPAMPAAQQDAIFKGSCSHASDIGAN
jgi:hypothetical protein